ncbi:ABC-type transport auxiliary lipoprotein family protein [Nitrosococcus wardiae]|nr:ABC-type transport auxiliary lipoprotein family protein [Nitrosococcus wardiae]
MIIILSSCTLSPEQSGPVRTYILAPQLPPQTAASPTRLTLLVSTPQAAAGYGTPQIAYTRKPYELDYFSRNQWVDTPGRMLKPILVNALEASGLFQSVAPGDTRILAELRLDTEILRLVQDFSDQPSQSHLILRARLIDLARGEEIASRIFKAQEPAPEEGPYGGVIALNRALERILGELVAFCTQAYLKR